MNKPNVLIIVLDTVRAQDTLDNSPRTTTPYLSSFSSRDDVTMFTNARSPALWTLPSHVSMFTGDEVHEHDVTTLGEAYTGDTVFDTLATDGYRTGVFTENPFLASSAFGLNDTFQYTAPYLNVLFPDALTPQAYEMQEGRKPYVEYLRDSVLSKRPVRSLANGAYPLFLSSTAIGGRVTDERNDAQKHSAAFNSWRQRDDGPWAACLNFVDAHAPYRPTTDNNLFAPDSYRRRPEYADPTQDASDDALSISHDLYCGGIRQTDTAVRYIIEQLEDDGVFDDTLVVITSDHGEAFGEYAEHDPDRRLVAHRGGLNEEQLRVPLIVRPPSGGGGVREQLSSPIGFADAVEALLAGEDIEPAFERDTLLVSHEYEGSTTADGTGEYIRALYTRNGASRLLKHVDDNGETAEFEVTSDGTVTTVDGVTNEVDGHLRRDSKAADSRGEDVPTDRLRDLGYLDS